MKKILFISLTIISAAMAACSKHRGDIEDTTPRATIQFMNPTDGAVYNANDSVSIRAFAVSTATIHGYDIIIRKADDTTKLYFAHIHDHNDTIQVSKQWKPTVNNTSLQAELVLYLDHDGHTGHKKVNFRIQ